MTVETLERLSSYGETVRTNKEAKLLVSTPGGMQSTELPSRAEIEIDSSLRPIFHLSLLAIVAHSPFLVWSARHRSKERQYHHTNGIKT